MALVRTPDIYFSLRFSFLKAIQELIKVSEGDMRKVRQEAVMTGNVFLLKLTLFVTINKTFFFKKEGPDAMLPLCPSLHQKKDRRICFMILCTCYLAHPCFPTDSHFETVCFVGLHVRVYMGY